MSEFKTVNRDGALKVIRLKPVMLSVKPSKDSEPKEFRFNTIAEAASFLRGLWESQKMSDPSVAKATFKGENIKL